MSDYKYEAVVWNDVLGRAYQNVIHGKPDCFDIIEKDLSFAEAVRVAAGHSGNCAVRAIGDQKTIVRGYSEISIAANLARKTGLDNDDLIKKFKEVYYSENFEYLEYV